MPLQKTDPLQALVDGKTHQINSVLTHYSLPSHWYSLVNYLLVQWLVDYKVSWAAHQQCNVMIAFTGRGLHWFDWHQWSKWWTNGKKDRLGRYVLQLVRQGQGVRDWRRMGKSRRQQQWDNMCMEWISLFSHAEHSLPLFIWGITESMGISHCQSASGSPSQGEITQYTPDNK